MQNAKLKKKFLEEKKGKNGFCVLGKRSTVQRQSYRDGRSNAIQKVVPHIREAQCIGRNGADISRAGKDEGIPNEGA